MCGIIGFYTGIPRYKVNREFVYQALYCGALRGVDGTGLVGITSANIEIIQKKAMPAADFLETRAADAVLNRMGDLKCVIGHNRFKTQGIASNRNTHPFQHGHITMVHNGSVAMHLLPGNQEVDSEQVAHALSTIGIEETVSKLSGAFALVWYDSNEQVMRVIRNEDRPLWLAKDKNHETVYFASEGYMLRWIAWRNNIELEPMYQPKPGQLLTFKGMSATPESHEVKLREPPMYANTTRLPLAIPDMPVGLAHGDYVELHPVSWETSSAPTPNTYGTLILMSTEHTQLFRWIGCRYKEIDASKSYSCRIMGTANVNGVHYVSVGNPIAKGENAFEIQDDMVWLQQTKTPVAKSKVAEKAEEAGEHKEGTLLPGPDNALVDEATYLKFIKHGCCMCGEHLDIDDAPTITFDKEGNAYCDDCIDNPIVQKFMLEGGGL